MKKLVVLIILMFIITSCSPQQDTVVEPESTEEIKEQVKEKTTTVEKKVEEDQVEPKEEQKEQAKATVVVETKPEPKPTGVQAGPSADKPTELPQELSPQVKDLLKRADKKVKSFSYTLAPPPDQLARDKWLVRGNMIKVEMYDDNYVEPDTYYDNIFIDTQKKSAVGVCLSQRTTRCADQGQEFPLDYDSTLKKTPYQWLKSITATPKIISSELLYDRKMDVIEYVQGGQKYTQWIDQFSGLPVRVQIGDDKKSRYEYRYMAINNVAIAEVTKP